MELVLTPEEIEERTQHEEALASIRFLCSTLPGKNFIKYLFRTLDVAELVPQIGLSGEMLHDRLGFMRAGQSIFKIIAQVDPETAGLILAQLEREKHEKMVRDYFRQGT